MANAAISQIPFSQRLEASSRRLFRWLKTPRVFLSLIMLVIMFYLVIIPLYRMVEITLTYQEKDLFRVPTAEVGHLTLFHYIRMFTSEMSKPYLYDPLVHSMVISFGATGIAFVIGGLLAWMCIRTDMPGRKLINQLALLPYIMPGWTIAQAWTVLFKNRITGGSSGVFEYLIGQSPPGWLSYGPVPIMISSALHYYTFFFLFVTAALMSIDSSLEEAGDLMGASRSRILRKITFPLVLPALLSGFIMTFSKVMGTYGGPALLGVPVKYYTISTMIRSAIGIGDKADGFVLAITLILFSMVNIYINQKLVGTRKSYETIGGRGFMAQTSKLRNWKGALTTIVIVFQVLVIVLPLGLLAFDTFMLRSGDYSLDNLTLHNWIGQSNPRINNGSPGILRNPKIYDYAWNSVRLSIWTALFTALLGVILGYAVVKGRGTRLSKLVEQLAFIPYVIPGIAFGAVYISMFARRFGPIPPLYGTFALLVVVSVAKHIPYSSRTGVSAMLQVGRELSPAPTSGSVSGRLSSRSLAAVLSPDSC
jgi:iron(III) transport system permease protein